MTTNEIKTLIQNTIAGQGSQVDIGGKLAEILGAIVDAIPSGDGPMTVEFTKVDGSLTVKDGQPSFNDAINAFDQGRTVRFVIEIPDPDVAERLETNVVGFYPGQGIAYPYFLAVQGWDDAVVEPFAVSAW